MTRPTARVLALLELLQLGGTRTVGDLAERLGVDERTVRRYASHLIDLGIPVRAVRGRHGGYRLASGFRLPPLMFTDEEGLAVLAGLVLGRRAGVVTTSSTAIEAAAAKLRRVMPDLLVERLDALLDATDVTGPERQGSAAPETSVLLRFAEAVRDRRPVAIGYTAGDGRPTERQVEPYGIVAHGGRWYVTGRDSRSGELRSFRLDRMASVAVVDGTFDVAGGFDPAAHLLGGIAAAPHRYRVALRVQGDPDVVRARFPVGLAIVEARADPEGWVGVRLHAARLDWVPGVLVQVGLPFAVDTPDELRVEVRTVAARLLAAVG